MTVSRRKILLGVAGTMLVTGAAFAALYRPYPSDRTPEGAYMRVARGVTSDNPSVFFAYLETEAQWACYTIRDMRRKARERVMASYPEPQRSELTAAYAPFADAPDGSDVFAHLYRTKQWSRRLRKDMSGSVRVETDAKGERASVVTVQGTRWPFRKRDNGIWGLTVFTAELLAEAEKATRDLDVVEAAAADYDRIRERR
ncbi:MAG: hypothetical protein BGO98_32850 [Myxococcales bacterium 68-20]|nr:hypothetical protein [Myxococcales bacterium]OJY18524.1 MAG: hypothetical protein BGO98_32850 [Myxococcales bacterium 68-20]